MTPIRVFAVVLFLAACQPSRADLILRQAIQLKFGAFLAPSAAAAIEAQLASTLPKEVVTKVKGDLIYSTLGATSSIMDCGADRITILDPKSKRFATFGLADYPGKVTGGAGVIPAEAIRALQDLKIDVKDSSTGRTGMLHGIRAEEHETVMTLDLPGQQSVPLGFKLVMQSWFASAEEINRIPALKEYSGYSSRVKAKVGAYDMMRNAFSQLPGLGEKFGGALENLSAANRGLVLKSHMAAYAPAVAQMLEQLQNSGKPAPAGFDSDAPLFEFSMDLAEISTAAVPDSIFQAPADYHTATMEELWGGFFPAKPSTPALVR